MVKMHELRYNVPSVCFAAFFQRAQAVQEFVLFIFVTHMFLLIT